MRLAKLSYRRLRLSDEDGFTMAITLAIMLVTSLLIASALANASGDVRLTRANTGAQDAYYAAQAGIQVYEFHLNTELEYWLQCPASEYEGSTSKAVPLLEESKQSYNEEKYKYETLGANGKTCTSGQQSTIVQTSGSATGTFRVKSTGYANGIERSIVATLKHPGFLNYVFLSNYEVEDPSTLPTKPTDCEHYYLERKKHEEEKPTEKWLKDCPPIPFIATDEVKGPFHTNDSVSVCAYEGGKPSFGRTGFSDAIEMNQGHYAANSKEKEFQNCNGKNELTLNGKFKENGPTLYPPPTDTELLESAETKYEGRTILELNGSTSPNTITVTNALVNSGKPETINFPKNGVLYVNNVVSKSCGYTYSPFSYDEDYEKDANCGNVYVKGTYSESLTIATANDIIVTGNLTTTGEKGKFSEATKPSGTALLGLIAQDFVRVYHPVEATGKKVSTREKCEGKNQTESSTAITKELKAGSNADLIIDAAILSTKNSFIVDNWGCGTSLGELIVWGGIAQYWRGRVTNFQIISLIPLRLEWSGYPEKNYNYDERMKTRQPPNFLSPTTSGGWEIVREVAPAEKFSERGAR
jgi:hypothetical protein